MSHTQQLLKEYGLTGRESAVYIHLLKNLEDTIWGISKATKIPRATLYKIMAGLQLKHLVSNFRKNQSEYWVAESLRQLQVNLEKKQEALDKVFPLLRSIASSDFMNSESVRVFSGKDGLKAVWEDILATLEERKERFVYAVSSADLYEHLPRYYPKWVARRQKNKTFARLILEQGQRHTQTGEYQEVRHAPGKYISSGDITIYGSKVAFFSFSKSKLSAVIIESKTIHNMMKGFFGFMWDALGSE